MHFSSKWFKWLPDEDLVHSLFVFSCQFLCCTFECCLNYVPSFKNPNAAEEKREIFTFLKDILFPKCVIQVHFWWWDFDKMRGHLEQQCENYIGYSFKHFNRILFVMMIR